MRFAIVEHGAVTNIAIAVEPLAPNWVRSDTANIGDTYDGETFSAPPEAAKAPTPRRVSVGAFFDRFGAAKWAILADTSPAVQALVKDCSVRAFIDLDRPDLPQALGLLAQTGHVIDAAAILAADVQPSEAP